MSVVAEFRLFAICFCRHMTAEKTPPNHENLMNEVKKHN